MYCLLGLFGTLIMGILGREAWNDARAWRNFFQRSSAGSTPNTWPGAAPDRCAAGTSLACRNCAVHRVATDF